MHFTYFRFLLYFLIVVGGGRITGTIYSDLWRADNPSLTTWTQLTTPNVSDFFSLLCDADDRLIKVGGFYHIEQFSIDMGITWSTPRTRNDTAISRSLFPAVLIPSSGNRDFLVIGGSDNTQDLSDVWRYSKELDDYTLVCASAPWDARRMHLAQYVDSNSLVIMASSYSDFRHDVWISLDDGASWSMQVAAASWSPRYSAALWSIHGILTMGFGFDTTYNDQVFQSADAGVSWTLVNAAIGHPVSEAAYAVYDGKLLMCGGVESSGNPTYVNIFE